MVELGFKPHRMLEDSTNPCKAKCNTSNLDLVIDITCTKCYRDQVGHVNERGGLGKK